MPNVRFVHPDLKAVKSQYELVSDCIAGQEQVKYRKDKYLPRPNAADDSEENRARYDAYLVRAVFYNVTRRTQAGLVGAIFETPPTEKLPADLKPIIENASGGGVTLEQLAHKAAGYDLAFGRLGLFVDFPDAPETGTSVADAGKFNPNITVYDPLDIINWRVEEVNGKDQLTLVVLQEEYIVSDDGFEQVKKKQFRELRLVGGRYYAQIWRENTETPWKRFLDITDQKGNPLDHIPFTFIGSENNDADVDYPPMYDLASINVAHYRNSADYEEATFIVGQPTPWFAGLSEDWVKTVFNGRVELGSRAAIALPVDASAGILQPTETTMAFEAMEHKERQMVALGAKLVEQAAVQRTAAEAKMENKSETSVLANVARNVSSGLEFALAQCRLFMVGDGSQEGIEYQLNTAFGLADMTPEELTMIMTAWQGSAITFTEMRDRLRFAGIATEDDAAAQSTIETALVKADARETKKLGEQANASAKAQADHPKPPVGK